MVLDVLDGVGVFGYLRRDVRAVECDALHAPVFSRTEGDSRVLTVLNPEHHRRVLHHLVVVAHVTLSDGDDGQTVVYLLILHGHFHVLVEVFDEIFALNGLLGGERVHHQTVREQTVRNQRIVHRDVLDLIALVCCEGDQDGITLIVGGDDRVVPHGQHRVALAVQRVLQSREERVSRTHGDTEAFRYECQLVFSTDNPIELLDPVQRLQELGPGTLGHLQRGLRMDALKHAEVYLERFHEFHLHPLQTVAILKGSLL